jgi:glyoxylase-like metal-dependent hydrolase (beta-lactamase superfamily II)
MPFRQISPGVHQLTLRGVNCFLLLTDDGPVLVDTGMPEHGVKILEELKAAGADKLSGILVSHCHPDHAGGLSFIKAETGAETWAHPDDARLIEDGVSMRPLHPAPGTFNRIMHKMVIAKGSSSIPACAIDRKVENGHMLPGGLIAIHTPGHSAGHLSFLWPEKKVLLAGDVASHMGWLRPSPAYEDYQLGLQSLRRLVDLKFEVATFGHGTPIRKEAVSRFRDRFGQPGEVRFAG